MNWSLYYENTKKFMKCKTSTSYSAYVVFAIWIYEDLLKDVRIPWKEKNPNETAIHRLLKWFQIQIIINFGVCTNEAIAVDLVTI